MKNIIDRAAKRICSNWRLHKRLPRLARIARTMLVSEQMIEAGNTIASNLIGANVAKNMNGAGGSMQWDEWIKEEKPPHQDLLLAYANDEIDAVVAIYLAMERAKYVISKKSTLTRREMRDAK